MLLENSSNSILLIFGLFLCFLSPGSAIDGETNLRKMILRIPTQLMSRPVATVAEKVSVVLEVKPVHVNDVDEENGILTLTVWISQKWKGLFTWDKTQFDEVDKLIVSGDTYKVWHPDTTLIHSVGENTYLPSEMDNQFTMKNNGEMLWWVKTTLKSPCNFANSTAVRCDLVFGSWQHTGIEVDIKVSHSSDDMDPLENYKPTGAWKITNVEYSRSEAYYGCCSDPFPQIIVHLDMKKTTSDEIISSQAVGIVPSQVLFMLISVISLARAVCA